MNKKELEDKLSKQAEGRAEEFTVERGVQNELDKAELWKAIKELRKAVEELSVSQDEMILQMTKITKNHLYHVGEDIKELYKISRDLVKFREDMLDGK